MRADDLPERERKGLDAGIKELNFYDRFRDGSSLPDELVHSRLPDVAHSISARIGAVVIAGSRAI